MGVGSGNGVAVAVGVGVGTGVAVGVGVGVGEAHAASRPMASPKEVMTRVARFIGFSANQRTESVTLWGVLDLE